MATEDEKDQTVIEQAMHRITSVFSGCPTRGRIHRWSLLTGKCSLCGATYPYFEDRQTTSPEDK
jgi:hypothetical protein